VVADHRRKSGLFSVFESELVIVYEHGFECSLGVEAWKYLILGERSIRPIQTVDRLAGEGISVQSKLHLALRERSTDSNQSQLKQVEAIPNSGVLREGKSMVRNKVARKGVLCGYLTFRYRKTSAIFPKILQ